MSQLSDEMDYWDQFYATYSQSQRDGFKVAGRLDIDSIMNHVHRYLNEVSIDECLAGEDYMLLIFAILDRRVGKRRIKELFDRQDDYPDWMSKWVRLRAEAENLVKK